MMRRLLLVVLVLAVAHGASAALPALGDDGAWPPGMVARVELYDAPVVVGDTIYLGDIAAIEATDPVLARRLAELNVGRAALPGTSRELAVGSLVLRVRQARLPEREIHFVAPSERIVVHTRSQVVRGAEIVDQIRAWYEGRLTVPDGGRLIVEATVLDVTAPVGAYEIRFNGGSIGWGRNSISVDVWVDGRHAKRMQVSVSASVLQSVYVASRPLSRGDVIGAADVVQKELELARPAERFQPGSVRATRAVREGTVLTSGVVEPVPIVARGTRVMIESVVGSVQVRVDGVAEQDGWLGDEIAVRNLASGNIVHARVEADGGVRVLTW